MINTKSIPSHWKLSIIGDECKVILGQSPPSSSYNTEKIGLPFFQGKAEFTDLHPIISKWCNAPKKIAEPNDVLISVRAPVGATNVADHICCIGRGLAALRTKNHKYLFYFLRSIEHKIDELGTGTTFRAIAGDTLKNISLPIPPEIEQQQIVEKIEELFSELDSGKRQLENVRQQLKTYRQAVLKYAFEGKLTNTNVKDGELPEGWKRVKVRDIAVDIQYGYTESATTKNVGPKFLRITDIQNNKVYWDTVPYCKISKGDKERKNLKDGDLVFARTGATVGKSFLIKGEIPESVFASYLIRIRFPKFISDKYVWHFFQSNIYWRQIFKGQVGTGQPNVNGTKLGELLLPLAPFEDQLLIVQEIESRLSLCSKLEETIEICQRQSEGLKQSILKQAFEGKLVKPQNT